MTYALPHGSQKARKLKDEQTLKAVLILRPKGLFDDYFFFP